MGTALALRNTSTMLESTSQPLAQNTSSSSTTGINPLSSARSPLPEFQGISQWLNSDPLSIGNLRGNIVLIQFWTFACINCQRTLPSLVQWHQQYASQGLKVIGVHTPEFAYEREINNIKRALQKHKITYPVAVDNDYQTWRAYHNAYWPHLFLADREGQLRYDHIGEGAYEETERLIRQLLG
ncbi:thioredoxin family protein [Phormidium tenue]|uniref:thioredoxin family protein n=1 Tax=Phormidium tenue TaxID=126344 RepID=UPI001FD14AEF|nr:thioredoxin family protein [Phormidium tenue]